MNNQCADTRYEVLDVVLSNRHLIPRLGVTVPMDYIVPFDDGSRDARSTPSSLGTTGKESDWRQSLHRPLLPQKHLSTVGQRQSSNRLPARSVVSARKERIPSRGGTKQRASCGVENRRIDHWRFMSVRRKGVLARPESDDHRPACDSTGRAGWSH